jgi:CDP-diacylglycerol--glycerol-3-phosphate 3-phosphatidyltransferase
MISYQRSKAESLGLAAKGGLMERAERMVLLGVALLATQIFIPVLWLLLVLTIMTAVGRFWRVWQIAARPEPPVQRRPRRNYQHTGRLRRGPSRTSRH